MSKATDAFEKAASELEELVYNARSCDKGSPLDDFGVRPYIWEILNNLESDLSRDE